MVPNPTRSLLGEYVQGVGTNPPPRLGVSFSRPMSFLGVGGYLWHQVPFGEWVLTAFLFHHVFDTNIFGVKRVPIRDWNNGKVFSGQGKVRDF